MDTVAEGVETRVQALFLAAQGCRLAQGRWFGDPVPAAELTAALRDASNALKRGARKPMNVVWSRSAHSESCSPTSPSPTRSRSRTRSRRRAGPCTRRRTTGGDGLEAALLDRGWDAVLFGGEGDAAVPARKALALVRLADPHLPFVAITRSVRRHDLAAVVKGLEAGIAVAAGPVEVAETLQRELSAARTPPRRGPRAPAAARPAGDHRPPRQRPGPREPA